MRTKRTKGGDSVKEAQEMVPPVETKSVLEISGRHLPPRGAAGCRELELCYSAATIAESKRGKNTLASFSYPPIPC